METVPTNLFRQLGDAPRPQDAKRINIHEDYELRDWSKKLGVSEEELKAAVKKVGTSADAVEKHLAGKVH